ncbi:porin family protein [Hymenobacter armeniacus]|uniref:PorT family protein n=1 Tax=Hymenobacter armeniacus TaxID=2771358 RepID=A0ABR8K1X7_9BACT|nr:porin family protein [Hymenobacter armeniacus]MBD2724479.1 PorT family protein [Hymenobacter armeniacus]
MKKILLAALAFAATIGTASAQVEIGLKVSPSITSLRAESTSANAFKSDGSQLGFGGGLVVDYFFGENYAFSTGLLLTGKGGTITYNDINNGSNTPVVVKPKIGIQYLELPVTVKLFTNEIASATRLYFQVGGSLNVPIGTRINGSKFYTDPGTGTEVKAGDYVYFIDADALVGAGVEYQMGKSTKLFAGLSYHRGLVDIDHYFESKRGFKDVTIKNSSVALDLGIKF